jgi:hypothetical protein
VSCHEEVPCEFIEDTKPSVPSLRVIEPPILVADDSQPLPALPPPPRVSREDAIVAVFLVAILAVGLIAGLCGFGIAKALFSGGTCR